MALKNMMNTQDAFTGQVPTSWGKDGLWRFNEDAPDETCLADSSGNGRKAYINNWSGTTAALKAAYSVLFPDEYQQSFLGADLSARSRMTARCSPTSESGSSSAAG
jgi:hypothetical protein